MEASKYKEEASTDINAVLALRHHVAETSPACASRGMSLSHALTRQQLCSREG